MAVSRSFIRATKQALAGAAVKGDAGPMQAYMKSELPYYGVKKPARAKLMREVITNHALDDYTHWRDTVEALYGKAKYREERYAALDLVRARAYKDHARAWKSFSLYAYLIDEGAWWELVDETATLHLGSLMDEHEARCAPRMRKWAVHKNLWRRRSAIICQIKRKSRTDTALLFDAVRANMHSSEFFLRKGIGWALREHSKTDPAAVAEFVGAHEQELSSLSKREALRRIKAKAKA